MILFWNVFSQLNEISVQSPSNQQKCLYLIAHSELFILLISSTLSIAFSIILKVWCTTACGKEYSFNSPLWKCRLILDLPALYFIPLKETMNDLLSFYLLCATDGICHVLLHSSFFPGWKELVYYTLIMLIPSCTFDHPCISTRTWRGTEKLNDIAGQFQSWVYRSL